MKSRWVMYVLLCADGSLYCGVTTDTARRLREHGGELVGGARYTRGRRPVRLVHEEGHPDRSSACRAEAAFESLIRKEKLSYIGKTEEELATAGGR